MRAILYTIEREKKVMSTWESLMQEAEEEQAFLEYLRSRDMTIQEWQREKELDELEEDLKKQKKEILIQGRKAEVEVQKLQEMLEFYNGILDSNDMSPTEGLLEGISNWKIHRYFNWLLEEIQFLKTSKEIHQNGRG